ncbi:long-chain fatty acid--CoA ligase [Streptomyces albidoflavus]|uniref:AMP-dependent synthetase/ligase n=1 Tax=Streptomyces albidoflavus TaxID=1886 RepID=UPI00101E46AE|nr:AMP-dependent synthetase/ligase [Streptomyces albidoflavus]RZD91293.1 long-chain fatty acid--CoA ligase [Streptomyces albidoflavus]RZE08260.1 long-chain fatty acid--CoA ligase [Streptomyces albidoflavus]RZE10181.1 long-chain fatty acid--CoA ligase [Streptomyces albidoflavus]
MREVSVERLVAPPVSGGLADSVFHTAATYPTRPQLALEPTQPGGPWRTVTAARLRDEVLALARGLLAEGVRPGDRVVLMSRTRPEWTLLAYALWTLGAEVVPVYPTSSIEQVRWVLADASVRAAVVEHSGQAMTIAAACADPGALLGLWQLDLDCTAELAERGAEVPEDEVLRLRAAVRPEATAVICYTSGTTGAAKGCVISHANLAAECDTLIAGWGHLLAPRGEQPSVLAFLPLAHCYGLMVVVTCVRGGYLLAHQPEMAPAVLLPALASFRPTFLFAVPYIFERIFDEACREAEAAGHGVIFEKARAAAVAHAEAREKHTAGTGHGPGPVTRLRHSVYERAVYAKVRAVFGGRVRSAVSGGSPLRRELGLFFQGAGVTVYDGYGLTETTAAVTAQPPGRVRFGTVGRPLPGSTVRIAGDGEVWVRGDTVFRGYLHDPPGLADGWLATGDTGRFDPDGYLVITGRKKDIIITSGGKSVSPQLLEEQLRRHPLIAQCLVVGDNRPYVAALLTVDQEALAHWQRLRGASGRAASAPADDTELRAQLQRAVNQANTLVSRAESIRAFEILPVDFTRQEGLMTPSFKLRRSAVTDTYAEVIEALYAR